MTANAWQIHCTSILMGILDRSGYSQQDRVQEWTTEKMLLAQKQRVIVADADLTQRNLTDFDFSYVYFARVKFVRANLTRAKFRRATFLDCSMRGADLDRASLWLADTKTMDLAEVRNYSRADLNTNTPITRQNYARPLLVRLAEDHRYKQDIPISGIGGWFGRFLAWTDFGARLLPTVYIVGGVNVAFGTLYWLIEKAWNGTFVFAGNAKGSFDYVTMLLMAFQRFTNAPALIESSNVAVGYLFVANAIMGLLAVGVFIAQVTKLLVMSSR